MPGPTPATGRKKSPTTPRKTRRSSANRIAILAAVLSLVALANAAHAADAPIERSVFISPEIAASIFVTDKGEWTSANGAFDSRDVHTGDYNVLLMPAATFGYARTPWTMGLRFGFPVQWVNLDLPGGETAAGTMTFMELGVQATYDLVGDANRRAYLLAAVSFNANGETELDIRDRDDRQLASRTFETDRQMRNLRFLVGGGYDWKISPDFSAGLLGYGMISTVDLVSTDEETDGAGGAGEESLELTIYSVLIGARCRFDLRL
ncbi:MAG: hypothetical protein KJ042_18780 [Deltaproteobacteria bacterium]|nr:hypothetical protein [Deltaproteobacteria bacterium]